MRCARTLLLLTIVAAVAHRGDASKKSQAKKKKAAKGDKPAVAADADAAAVAAVAAARDALGALWLPEESEVLLRSHLLVYAKARGTTHAGHRFPLRRGPRWSSVWSPSKVSKKTEEPRLFSHPTARALGAARGCC